MEEELVFGEADVFEFFRGVDNAMCTLLQGGFKLETVSNSGNFVVGNRPDTNGIMSAGCEVSLWASSSL